MKPTQDLPDALSGGEVSGEAGGLTGPSVAGGELAAARLRGEREALLRYVAKLLAPDLRHAEDVVQETLLRAWLRADQLDWQERPIRPWLFRIAHNLAVDTWRKDRAIPVGSAADVRPDTADWDDLADRVVDRRWLQQAMRRLPYAHHEVLVHVHIYGRGSEEVADVLGIPRGTVKSRTHHALRSLRRELGVLENEETAA
ncbi:sigma-70 family RNA polymerase sigma factor [Streptomyces sp. NPDC008317]|uniref:sigma-70 family RNA polymerase sigma factor n=1 Tax=Streptomyces sp. NPDC008317 TaxID=3364827 RepID=UPI0036EE4CEA